MDYFSRALIREKAQAILLKEYGLTQRFRKYQLALTMAEVYKPKLNRLQGDSLLFAEKTLEEIYSLYEAWLVEMSQVWPDFTSGDSDRIENIC